ncbi:MAG: hypothetical protein JRI95_09680 [Deltaproteobacteria bacterium]|nr:hypothetical protein [Deltaproteobacteria bacterium]
MRINKNRLRLAELAVLWLIMTLISSPAYPLEKLNRIITPQDELGKFLPEFQVYSGYHYFSKRNYNYKFNAIAKTDPESGEVEFEFISYIYELRATMDQALRIKECVFTAKDKDAIKRLKHDKRVSRLVTESKDQMRIEFFLEGEKVKEKEVGYDYLTLDLAMAHITAQALLLKGIKEFNCDVILEDKAWKLNVDFKLIRTRNVQELAPQYDYPEKLKERWKSKEEYLVYEVRVTGAIGFFYRHKYYLVFTAEKPYHFVAYWGGDPNWVEFFFVDKKTQ